MLEDSINVSRAHRLVKTYKSRKKRTSQDLFSNESIQKIPPSVSSKSPQKNPTKNPQKQLKVKNIKKRDNKNIYLNL